ncbi:MAG: HdeA/HdeB family chaperone [Gammaproteobacteria bacterium]|nr:HdeA/HdeB family chaperone [Gammaproteobacteria bacterium]
MNSFASIILFLATLLCANANYAADDTGQYLTMGLGNLSCKSFLTEDEKGAAYYLSWLAGYMTAYNYLQEETYSILGKTKTVNQVESWLRDYCTINGDQTFEEAARNLLRNLKYFRIKQK